MDDPDMAFSGHWGQDTEPGNDFMNMMPDFDTLTANSHTVSPPRATELSLNQETSYESAFNNEALSLQQSSTQSLRQIQPTDTIDPSLESVGASRKSSVQQAFDENLSAWGLDTQKHPVTLPREEGDSASCSSSCVGSCPSHCGVGGQGEVCLDDDCLGGEHPGICCADDNCGVESLCVDESCKAAHSPCTDENCIPDGTNAVTTRAETVAAAALTSFGGDSGNSRVMSHFDCGHMHSFGGDYSQFPATSSQHNCGFNMDQGFDNGMSVNAVGAPGFDYPDQFWQQNPALAVASHIFHYHDPSHEETDSSRPCFVDNPNLTLSRCTLPVFTGDDSLDFNTYLNLDPGSQCGFHIQDPVIYREHVMTQHRSLLSNLPAFAPCINTANLAPSFNNGMNCRHMNHANHAAFHMNHHHNPGLLSFNFDSEPGRQRPGSTPVSSGTIASVQTSPLPTPEAISTPPPGELGSKLPIDVAMGTPEIEGSFDAESTFQCFWKDAKTGKLCLKIFNDSEELDAHCRKDHVKTMQRVDGGYPCMWQPCKREHGNFSQRGKLNRHLQVHTGLKPTECPVCGVKLSAKQALDQHMRLHTNECPYVCDWPGCNRGFKQRSALTMHYRTHTGEKPLKCDICGAMFRESSNLTKHRRIHNDKGMYECDICHRDFNRLDQLRRHLNSNHKDMPEAVIEALKNAKPVARQVAAGRRHARHVKHSSNSSQRAGSSSAASPTGVSSTSPEPIQAGEQPGFLDEMTMTDVF